jgi:two-component system OmpR family response regulator
MRHEGATVRIGGDAAAALAAAEVDRPDAVIVDAWLPDMDGARCVHRLRVRQPALPAVLLDSTPSEPDRRSRLQACADRLRKPFSIEEMLLQLRMVLQRNGVALQGDYAQMIIGDLVLRVGSRQVTRSGKVIPLTLREFELLRFFMRNADRVVTRQQILSRVWPYDFPRRTNVVGMYVCYLRRKVDKGRTPLIHTLPRTGYILKSLTA